MPNRGFHSPRRRRGKNPQGPRPALRAAGHEVIETANPRDGQRLLTERSFDVVLVDNVMPQLSGLDLIREYVVVHTRRRTAADPDDDAPTPPSRARSRR
jgi:DNA-binding NarL/FixJ family response regulator